MSIPSIAQSRCFGWTANFRWNRGICFTATEGRGKMKVRSSMLFAVLAALALLGAASGDQKKKANKATVKSSKAETLPVTTSSAAAARYFENGMVHYENHRWNLALNDWREAVKLDSKFALAYTWICMTTTDPAEESSNRAQAKAAMNG